MKPRLGWIAMLTMMLVGPGLAWADEGMWVFNNLPLKQLREKYGFEPSPDWIKHVQLSAVRFNSGGSGSFVSPDGLVMTNHHVGADTLQKISTPKRNYYETGFYAASRDQEVKAPDLELNVVVDIQDVTDRVNAEIQPGLSDAEADTARRRAMARIEKEATDRNGLRNDVVKLYQGGQYHLYTYKIYTDVRLVFAPEFAIAFFGGDTDNFEYPRYDLDVCFFRAYEDGQPAKVEHYLTWSASGTKAGDLVFVAGNPGRTSRLNTLAHLEYLRDVAFPLQLGFLKDREKFLQEYSSRGEEQARQAKEYLFGIQNSLKARTGGLVGLKNESFLRRKGEEERSPPLPDRRRSRTRPALRPRLGQDREGRADRRRDSQAVQLPRTRARLRQRTVPDRPRPRPARRGEPEARRGAAPRVSGVGPPLPGAGSLLRRSDLSRIREGEAGPLPRLLESPDARRPDDWSRPSGPPARQGCRGSGRRHEACRRGRPPPTGHRRFEGDRAVG